MSVSHTKTVKSLPPTEIKYLSCAENLTFVTKLLCPLNSLNYAFSTTQGYLNNFTWPRLSPVARI